MRQLRHLKILCSVRFLETRVTSGGNAMGKMLWEAEKAENRHTTQTERDMKMVSYSTHIQPTDCKSLYSLFIAIHKLNIKCNLSLYIREELHKPSCREGSRLVHDALHAIYTTLSFVWCSGYHRGPANSLQWLFAAIDLILLVCCSSFAKRPANTS